MRNSLRLTVFAALLATGAGGATAQTGTVPGTSIPYTQINTWGPISPTGAGMNLLTLGAGNIMMSSSLSWGGAIYDYAVNGSGNLVNRADSGRLWQSMINIHEPAPYAPKFVNPTEGGDKYNRGSAVLQAANVSPYVQTTKATPFGFLGQTNEDELGGTAPNAGNVAIQFNGMTIGKEVTLAFNGDNNVARYVAKVFSNVPGPRISGNLPILYLPGNFKHFTTYNAQTTQWLAHSVPRQAGDTLWGDYGVTTNCGGIMAENGDRTVGVALYGCRPGTRSGGAYHLAFTDQSGGSSDPLSSDTTALMSQIVEGDNISLPAGESSLVTYIISCRSTPTTLAGVGCVQSMANLYAAGY